MTFKQSVQAIFRAMGYNISKVPPEPKGIYDWIRSDYSTYSPWIGDKCFKDLYKQIEFYTMVDIYRLYELWTLVPEIKHIVGDVIEVGSWKGGSSGLLAHQIYRYAPGKTLHICDTFTGVVKCTNKDANYKDGQHNNASAKEVRDLLENKLGLYNYQIYEGTFPEDMYLKFHKEKFSLIHIDVDIHDSTKDCMDYLWPRLSVGGIVVYDDYGYHGTPGISSYVNSQRLMDDRLVIHNLNGHAIVVKLK
ncbi:MAG: class I SAM-dependent methyltransferase [Candidatus Peribacteraceae bacterium]|nr:class I SAM-dependent methyltransferase [Candidatus Peribacteraceae bacterium]